MHRVFLVLASLLGALGVGLGAFGAHGLRASVAADLLGTFETGVRYQMYHVLALLALGLLFDRLPHAGWATASGILFLAGIAVFSGSLYLLVFTGARWLGAITPLGGVAFVAGWLCLALAAWRG